MWTSGGVTCWTRFKLSIGSLAAAGVFCVTCQSQSVVAAEGSSAESAQSSRILEEVVVTAQRRDESIMEVPVTVAAMSGDELEALGILNDEDLAKVIPGFTVGMTSLNTPIYTLRGVGFDGNKVSSQSSVGIYMDEIAYTVPSMVTGTIFDLERAEVLKGPQGTLFGRNTTAGLVQFVSAKPTDHFEGSIMTTFGNFETFNVGGFISGPLTDTLKGRLAYRSLNSSKGWQKSVTRDDRLGEKDLLSLRGTLEWAPSESFQALLMMNYWRDRSDTRATQLRDFAFPAIPEVFIPAGVFESVPSDPGDNQDADWAPPGHDATPSELTRFKRGGGVPRNYDTYFLSPVLKLSYQLSERLKLHSATSYEELERDAFVDYDGSQLEFQQGGEIADVRSFQQEVRLSGEYDQGRWGVGAYFLDEELFDRRNAWLGDNPLIQFVRFFGTNILPTLVPDPLPHSLEQIGEGLRVSQNEGKQDHRSIAAFVDASYDISDVLTLTAGVRYTEDKIDFKGCTRDRFNNTAPIQNTVIAFFNGTYPLEIPPNGCTNILNVTAPGTAGLIEDELDEDNVSGRLVLDWMVHDDLLLYASISRGFKSGLFVPVGASLEISLFPVEQEELLAYEIGVKVSAENLRASVASFYYDFRDKQVQTTVEDETFGVLGRLVNIPKSTLWGGEADVTWELTPNWWLRAMASYTQTEVDGSFLAFDELGQPVDLGGNELPHTPEWQVSSQIGYEAPITNTLGFRGMVDWSWQSEHEGQLTNIAEGTIDAYGILNGRLDLFASSDEWSASLWVKNAFDKDYVATPMISTGAIAQFMGQPRTYGVTFEYSLGR